MQFQDLKVGCQRVKPIRSDGGLAGVRSSQGPQVAGTTQASQLPGPAAQAQMKNNKAA